jgi:hypothetical protein
VDARRPRGCCARRDAERVPAHARTVGVRSSPLTGSPRLAGNPANALLNYLYAILEAEATIAARVVGLDPGVGLLHADQLNRDSLSADLMEPVRPLVDRFVLGLLADRYFAAADFCETRQGVCRLTPAIARDLAATASAWAGAVGRVAEDVARLLADGAGMSSPTPISRRNRSRGRGVHGRVRRATSPRLGRRCTTCGAPTEGRRATCSDACAAEAAAASAEAFGAAGSVRLAEVRGSGRTAISDEGRQRVGAAVRSSIAAAREWQRTHPLPEPGTWERDYAPRVASLSVAGLARATGLSEAYCRRIKRGLVVPHPMWWEAVEAAQAAG